MKFADERQADTVSAPHELARRAASMSAPLEAEDDDDPEHGTGLERCTVVELATMGFMRVQGPAEKACRLAMTAIREGRRFPLQLVMVCEGSLTVRDPSERSVTLGPDDMALLDGNAGPTLLSLQFVDAWIIGLSDTLVARWLQGSAAATGHRLQGDRGWARVLSAYLRNWEFEQLNGLISPFEKEIIGEHVMSLLSMALAHGPAPAPGDASRGTQPACARDRGLHARMVQWIRDNYANPEIGVATLATRFGVSTRYVHKVFLNAGSGETFLDALRRERLEAAARLLRASAKGPAGVSDIAYACGFSDPGYFSQVFRRKYGMSPSDHARQGEPAPEDAGR
ncbi:AraC family transcriptional regulator [Variovorax sp. UMC13]|uniref:helix-turn-helix transcriptional regulator n=1 Tax=Variovorax sp. UMC13 TaxID=1862326 RepID=UPI0016036060|nr:AraC family transcriptional regulator [Variovorax sp. UMC13]